MCFCASSFFAFTSSINASCHICLYLHLLLTSHCHGICFCILPSMQPHHIYMVLVPTFHMHCYCFCITNFLVFLLLFFASFFFGCFDMFLKSMFSCFINYFIWFVQFFVFCCFGFACLKFSWFYLMCCASAICLDFTLHYCFNEFFSFPSFHLLFILFFL